MGSDKAQILVDGITLAHRIAQGVVDAGAAKVTILGREPLGGYEFLPDSEQGDGPLAALAAFKPTADWVLVLGCDLPALDEDTVRRLTKPGISDAIVPVLEGRAQPMCSLFSAGAWDDLAAVHAEGRRSMMAWLDRLQIEHLDEAALASRGIDPGRLAGANNPGMLAEIAACYRLRIG